MLTTRPGRGGHRIPVAALALLSLLLGVGLLAAAPAAQAHAVLVSSDPEDGVELDSAPAEVTFTFDEAVRIADDATAVVADDGRRIDLEASTTDGGKVLRITLQDSAPRGAYTASYRVVSEDGHIVSGAVRFGIGVTPSIADDAGEPADPLSVVEKAAQGLVYLGVILLIGVGLASAALWRFSEGSRRMRALRLCGWLALLAGSLLRLALTGPLAAGAGLSGVLTLTGAGLTVTTVGGVAGLVRVGLLAILLPWTLRPSLGGSWGRGVSGVAALAVLVTVALDGHAAAGSDAALATLAAVGHLAAMAAWLGGLVVLFAAVLPRAGWSQAEERSLVVWPRIAVASILVLVVTGLYQAWRQLHPLDSLLHTAYGTALLVKASVVILLLATGWFSHRALVRARRDGVSARLRRRVAVESVIALAVVVVTTVLVALPSARAAYGPAVELAAPAGQGTVRIEVDSTRTGVQHFTLTFDGGGEAQSVRGALAGDAVADVPVEFTPAEDGTWEGRAVVPVAGEWTLGLSIDLGPSGKFATQADYRVW